MLDRLPERLSPRSSPRLCGTIPRLVLAVAAASFGCASDFRLPGGDADGSGSSAASSTDGTSGETGDQPDVVYRAVGLNGADQQIFITRRDNVEGTCARLVLIHPSAGTPGVDLPPEWGVFEAHVSRKPEDCDEPAAEPTADAQPWEGAIGTVDWGMEDSLIPCELAVVDVRIDFVPLEGWPSTVDLVTTGLAVEDCQS